MKSFSSAIYSGKIRHRRFAPKPHDFEYSVFMMYLDLDEIDELFSLSPLWSLKHFSPVQFKRSDFHIHAQENIKNFPSISESIQKTVLQKTGIHITGPIRMLVNLRYWGVNMNPLSVYYCFAEDGENLIAILAEVHNTPWGERHAYVMTADNFSKKQHVTFSKEMHVSPFNPLNMEYHWHSTTPNDQLTIHLENWQSMYKIMDATMTLTRETINASSMNKILIRFPWMTVKVMSAIYWQALRLWLKNIPIFDHSKNNNNKPSASIKNITEVKTL